SSRLYYRCMMESVFRDQARAIFQAAIDAVNPAALVEQFVLDQPAFAREFEPAHRIIVVGGGKACAGMVLGLERALSTHLHKVSGMVNVPDSLVVPTRRIRLNPARPDSSNEPTAAAVAGTERMLQLVSEAAAEDIVICLLSGGGSSLICAPADGVS